MLWDWRWGAELRPEVIRTGQDRALVTAVFSAEGKAPWADWLEEYGLAESEDGDLILRRELQAGGKSRMLVNDQPVTLAAVRSLARRLVEMHGQNEHVALFARDAQLNLLDQFAGVERSWNACAICTRGAASWSRNWRVSARTNRSGCAHSTC